MAKQRLTRHQRGILSIICYAGRKAETTDGAVTCSAYLVEIWTEYQKYHLKKPRLYALKNALETLAHRGQISILATDFSDTYVTVMSDSGDGGKPTRF